MNTTAPAKPTLLPLNHSAVPEQLRNAPIWLGWRLEWERGRWTKTPINLATGGKAASDDPTTWTSFDHAVADYRIRRCDGVGFCRTGDLIFIDLDGVLDEAGDLKLYPWAKKILAVVSGRAYIEWSVAGMGLHAVCYGSLPPGRRQFDEPGLEHVGFALYDKSRYFTFSGHKMPESGPITDLTEELTKLHHELFPAKAISGNGHHAPHATVSLDLTDEELLGLARRAANGPSFSRLWHGDITGYASQSEADMALCCHLAFWTGRDADRMDALFRQSGLMRDKWARDDYRERTINKAIANCDDMYEPWKNGPKGAPFPAEETAGSGSYRVNGVNGVPPTGENGAGESTYAPGANWPDPPGEEAFYGLAGEWVRMVEPHTEADPAALLAQFLAAFGSVIGRGPHYVAEADKHFTNLFGVIVGRTAKSRKGTSQGQVQALFEQIDSEWSTGRVMSGLSSGEGLIWHVRDEIREMVPIREKGQSRREEQVTDPGEKDKRLFVVESEFATVLQRAERETNTLSAIIRQAWDTGSLRVLTKKQSVRATGAHISLIGHITRDELRRLLSSTEAANGFANRFLWVCAKRSKCLPDGGQLDQVDFAPLLRRLQAAVGFARTVGRMERDSETRVLWRDIYPALSEGRPGLFGAATSRSEAQVLRISCLYALLDRSAVVRVEHLAAAVLLWRYCEESARFIFGAALGDATADEILRMLRDHPEGVTRTDIREHFGRNKASAEIGRALSVLQEHGRARMAKENADQGRPVERWFAVSGTP